jgi:hypothetical protein
VYKQPGISAGEIHRRAEHVPLRRQSRPLPRNGWLGGRRPVDLLDVEPDTVADAARREAAERVF